MFFHRSNPIPSASWSSRRRTSSRCWCTASRGKISTSAKGGTRSSRGRIRTSTPISRLVSRRRWGATTSGNRSAPCSTRTRRATWRLGIWAGACEGVPWTSTSSEVRRMTGSIRIPDARDPRSCRRRSSAVWQSWSRLSPSARRLRARRWPTWCSRRVTCASSWTCLRLARIWTTGSRCT